MKNLQTKCNEILDLLVLLASSFKMSDKIFVNKYIPKVVPKDLPWYKRDGLMTYTDQLKYKRFMSNPNKYLEKAEVINFDMIYARCGRPPQQYSNKHYQTVHTSDVNRMSQKDRKKTIGACLRSEANDIFVNKKLTLFHFFEDRAMKSSIFCISI